MNKIFIFFILLLCFTGPSYPQIITTDVIMDSLTDNANALILDDINICTIKARDSAEFYKKRRILIKNRSGEKYCSLWLQESDFIEVKDIKAVITDTSGRKLKELHKNEIKESTISPDHILYVKNKNKHFEMVYHSYPYVFEYSYALELSSLFFWPSWYPQSDIPVLFSSYKLIIQYPTSYNTHNIGMEIFPLKTVERGDSVHYWEIKNVHPRISEDFLPPENELQIALFFAPENFRLGKISGSFANWDVMANWYRRMAEGSYQLSPEAQYEVQELIKGIDNKYEKVRVIYKYLQEKTRYAAIYLDIGGWKPNSAISVHKNRYGDCKDLTTYMVAMLTEAGIQAYPALAKTRDRGTVIKDFPSNQFNHCIAFVPFDQDTLWLECTADFLDIKDVPYTIEGIDALVIKDDAGEMIRTPVAPSNKNRWNSTSIAELNSSGNLKIKGCVKTTGKQKRYFKTLFEYAKNDEKKVQLQKIFGDHIPGLTINNYQFSEDGSDEKVVSISFDGNYDKAFSKSGSRLFVNPNIFNRKTSSNIPDETVDDRKFPIHFNYPYQDLDSVVIKIPYGYDLEAAPEMINIDNSFASFKTEYNFEDQYLTYVRYFEYKTNYFSRDLYSEYLEFLKTVVKFDQTKFVFKH